MTVWREKMNMETVYPKVASIIADVLAINEDKIDINQCLMGGLGAESIDLLDLIYQLEREFKIKIPLRQIEKESRGSLSDAEFEQNNIITAAGIESLKKHMPEVPEEFFKPNLKTSEIPKLFTVKTFCKIVVNAVASQHDPVPA